MRSPLFAFLFAAAVVVSLPPRNAHAQFASAIQGTVTDSSQAVVPDAKIRVTNITTGIVREAISSADGVYRVLSLGPGAYRVDVERTGFVPATRDAVKLGISETVRVDFQLQVGALTEQVTVAATPPLVETEQGRVSGRIDSQELKELPLNTRNLFNLLALQPGTSGRGISQGYGAGSPGDSFAGESGPDVYASGQRREANNFTVDETNVNGMARSGITNLTPNPESVAEVRVVSNNFSAAEGRSSGAQIQVVTKSGTNEFHGTLSHYFQNNTLSSRSTFDPVVPVFRRNLFGGTVGGPIVRNRTFFFFSYDGLRQSGESSSVSTVETPEFRDFVLATRPNSIAAKFFREFEPLVYPTSGFRDLGSPKPGVNEVGPRDGMMDVGSARFLSKRTRSGNQVSLRMDHDLRPGKDRIYGNFYRTNSSSENGTIRPVFNTPVDEFTTFGNLNYTHIFGPRVINEVRAGVMRLRGIPPPAQRLDIPALSAPGVTLRPGFSFPRGWAQTNYNYKDTLSVITSTHSIKIGGEVRRMYGWAENTGNYIPAYSFGSLLDFIDDEPLQMTRLVDPRTGEPATVETELRVTEWALFIQDDWKVRRNFNLNLGMRYENYGTLLDKQGLLRNLVLGSGTDFNSRLAAGKMDIVPRFYDPDNLNFGPRFGFAWDVKGDGKTSVRGGYGISYDRLMNLPAENYRSSPPLRARADLGLFFDTEFTYSLGDPSKPHYGYPIDPALKVGLDDRNGIKGSRVSVTTVYPKMVSPYVHNWFFGLQRSVGMGIVVEANYLGSAGHHLYNVVNVNRFVGDLLDGNLDGFNPSFSSINMVQPTSNSIYHGGTIQVRRAFQQGFSISGSYTFGKAIDDTDSAVGTTNWQDASDRSGERALAGYDVPQKVSIVGVWSLPFFTEPGTWTRRVLGGWQLSGFAIAEKGRPFTVTKSGSWPAGDFNGDGNGGDRPNAPTGIKMGGWTKEQFIDGIFAASDFPNPAPGTNGTLGRNTFRGPGFFQIDLSLAKRFAVTERIGAQLRIDGFNVMNRVNLNDPVSDMTRSDFGTSTGTSTPKLFQLGLRL